MLTKIEEPPTRLRLAGKGASMIAPLGESAVPKGSVPTTPCCDSPPPYGRVATCCDRGSAGRLAPPREGRNLLRPDRRPFTAFHTEIKSPRSGLFPPLGAGYVAYRLFYGCYMFVGVSL